MKSHQKSSAENKLLWLWSVVVGSVFGEEFAAGSGAVGVSGEGEDLCVVDEAIDHGRGDNVVG